MQYFASLANPGIAIVEPSRGYDVISAQEVLSSGYIIRPIYTYTQNWDAYKIFGCNCDPAFYGGDCSLRYCPKGDDPLTGSPTQVSTITNPTQFNEIQKVTCKSGGGYFTLQFRGKVTTRIPYDALAPDIQSAIEALPTIGRGGTKLVMYSSQACLSGGAYWTVEFLTNFGPLPNLVPDSSGLFFSDALSKAFVVVAKQVIGSKEDSECSDRGTCDSASGVCACATNYDTSNGMNALGTRGDCGAVTAVVQVCPGQTLCSGHGVCQGNPTYRCVCSAGWSGSDCNNRLCPSDVSWFTLPSATDEAHLYEQAECSDQGVCDRVRGMCSCFTGFSGAACEIMMCPGGLPPANPCNGNGQCLDMFSLATLATVNGDLAGFTYGAVPNTPGTWDAHKIHGCFCDPQYMGYDCSLFRCPLGDDPVTINQLDEVQMINCVDANLQGSLVFTFRQAVSAPVPASATIAELRAALEAVPTIGQVLVQATNNTGVDSLCSPHFTSGGVQIQFLSVHSDLPLLQVQSVNVDSVTVVEVVKGTKEFAECSNRGICDRTSGFCNCFAGFSSSDGLGNMGLLGDCGFLEIVIS